jgi:hypothetical protein
LEIKMIRKREDIFLMLSVFRLPQNLESDTLNAQL